jgi:hypothetical protein
LGCCIGGGLLLAGFCLWWYKVTLYLLCGMAGYLLSFFILSWKQDFILTHILARNMIGLALGSLFTLGFVVIEFATVILSLSLIGAYVFVLGLDLFIKTGFLIGLTNILYFNHPPSIPETKYTLDVKVYGMLFSVLGLWIVSSVWQRYYNKGDRFGLRVIKNTNNTLKVPLVERK